MTRRRVVGAVALLVVVAIAYTLWLLYVVQRDLRAAESDARSLKDAIDRGDQTRAEQATEDLRAHARSAADRSGGLWWGALTLTPFVGDDLEGVRGVSASLDEIGTVAAPALVGLDREVDSGLVSDGRVDLARLQTVSGRVVTASRSMDRAFGDVADLDSSGYNGLLRDTFDDYVKTVGDIRDGLTSARISTEVAPGLLGADGPRTYLLVFQNNAEIRATGGLTSSWALLRADRGALELTRQGPGQTFPMSSTPVLALTDEEKRVYGDVIGQYFADPLMNPSFPRAAQFFDAFWKREFPREPIDGVVTVDTVALSYLLRGTSPVTTEDGYTLNPTNVVRTLLSQVYRDYPDPRKQDDVFENAAASIFTSITSDVTSPIELLRGAFQAVQERRILVAPFDDDLRSRLAGTRAEGGFTQQVPTSPEVDVTVDDATGSKMSYYLDYDAQVSATSCRGGVQQLRGTMTLDQTISTRDAQSLPDYVTGGGRLGTPIGEQQVLVRIYAPRGGSLGPVELDGAELPRFTVATIDGREVITVSVILRDDKDVELTWTMEGGEGQDGPGRLSVTPGIAPGPSVFEFADACR